MDFSLLMICFAALVLPTLQFDDNKFRRGLSSAFDNLKRSAASLRGNLEFVGPLGGRYEANLDGAISKIGDLFNAETRGHLRAGVRRRGLLGGVQGSAGAIEGVLRRAPNALGADIAARLDNVHGNVFTGVHRNGVKGDLSFGSGSSRGFPFDSDYTSGLIGRALTRQCTGVPRSCLMRPGDRRAVPQFAFDERRNRCVQEYVSRACAREGFRNSVFSSKRECRRECNLL